MNVRRRFTSWFGPALLLAAAPAVAVAQSGRCDLDGVPGLLWHGTEPVMPVARLAAYAAPAFWFSPDEPLLQRRSGADIRIPEPFPGETVPEHPVVYYQVENLLSRGRAGDSAVLRDAEGQAVAFDLARTGAIHLSYYAYFHSEEGLGAHPHDIEPVEFRLAVVRSDDPGVRERVPRTARCPDRTFLVFLVRTSAKAHGLVWYWNVLETDAYTRLPMMLLVEEGKHALATDKNGDGVFTPGYDVNRRINDAWGTRDIIRTGMLYSGGFEAWMAKVRRPEHRVFPPLPDDSPVRSELAQMRGEGPAATYELRALPPLASAAGDPALYHLLHGKAVERWPAVDPLRAGELAEWMEEGIALKSLSVAVAADGSLGVSWSFPFLVVKHLESPMDGGYILHRMYLRGDDLKDFGWTLLYTPSASRWIDVYTAVGAENWWSTDPNTQVRDRQWDFVFETGVKFRVNLEHSPQPVRLLAHLTPFWGVRAGIRNRGAFQIENMRYVLEFGAGSF